MIREDLVQFNIHRFETTPMRIGDCFNVDPNAQDDEGHTVLHRYVSNRKFDAERIQHLISNGADLELRNQSGKTAFLLAVVLRQRKMIETLIKSGADVKVQDNRGNNALHYMVLPEWIYDIQQAEGFDFKDTLSMLKLLLDEGVDVNARNVGGLTPLMWAARGNHLKIVQMLLEFGADVHLRDRRMLTCLHYAAFYNSQDSRNVARWAVSKFEIFSELVRNKACVNCLDGQGCSPLSHILVFGQREYKTLFAKELIKAATLANWKRRMVFSITRNTLLGDRSETRKLKKYADNVYREIGLMKAHGLPGGYNLCEFANGEVPEDELRKVPAIKDAVLKIRAKESIRFYYELLLNRLGRLYLLRKASDLDLCVEGENGHIIYLNSDAIYIISNFLEDEDLFIFLTAYPERLN